jgi:hypothetical protein
VSKLRVRVRGTGGLARVVLKRRFTADSSGDILVGMVNLASPDADERLAELRMKAKDMARQLNSLEGE